MIGVTPTTSSTFSPTSIPTTPTTLPATLVIAATARMGCRCTWLSWWSSDGGRGGNKGCIYVFLLFRASSFFKEKLRPGMVEGREGICLLYHGG